MATEFDVVIAGGGIAGMTAGVTAARLGRKTLVLTGDVPGGQLMSIEKIEGYPGFPEGVPGYDLCPMLQDQAAAAGAEFMMTGLERLDAQDGKWRVTTGEGDILARAVIVATGSSLKKLDVPGEERLTGNGVSHCASCDAPLFRDRIVAVVGGGDSAMQEALTLAAFASKVIILHRGDALTGQASYRDRVTAHRKIEIRFNTAVTEILGEAKVAGLRTRTSREGAVADLEVDAVFAYVGLQPNTAVLQDRLSLDLAGQNTDRWLDAKRAGWRLRRRNRQRPIALSRGQRGRRWCERRRRRQSLSDGQCVAGRIIKTARKAAMPFRRNPGSGPAGSSIAKSSRMFGKIFPDTSRRIMAASSWSVGRLADAWRCGSRSRCKRVGISAGVAVSASAGVWHCRAAGPAVGFCAAEPDVLFLRFR